MTSWAERAQARFSETGRCHTAKTDETPASGAEASGVGTDETDETTLLSVSSVGVMAILKNSSLARELVEAAMLACDHHGDGEEAREAMRADCIATPPHMRGDLLDYFTQTYGTTP